MALHSPDIAWYSWGALRGYPTRATLMLIADIAVRLPLAGTSIVKAARPLALRIQTSTTCGP